MRLNRKCRRTLRDERAGLTFRWRMRAGSYLRTAAAVVLASGLALGLSTIFQVKGKTVRQVKTEALRLRILHPDRESTRELQDWVRRQSPFPDRWELDASGVLQAQLDRINAELARRTQYRPLLRPLPKVQAKPGLPDLFDLTRPRLPPIERRMQPVEPVLPREVVVSAKGLGALEGRWTPRSRPLGDLLGEQIPAEDAIQPEKELGVERDFLVRMNPGGIIDFCQAAEFPKNKLDAVLARWLRTQRGLPNPEASGMEWGKIRVSITSVEVTPESGGKEGPP